jgi:uroporphyrinogen-III synthase
VGEKTKSFLEENGLFVAYMFENAADLGNFIVNQGEIGPFLIFTGNRNRPEIVENFKDNNIAYTEVMVYETHLNPRTFEKQFQCVLFFSPSGVQSFVQANSTSDALALCIGETTADEARKHFTRVLVAERPTAQAVLDKLLKIYPTFTNS